MTKQHFFLFNDNLCQVRDEEALNYFSPAFWQAQNKVLGTSFGRGTTYFLDSMKEFKMTSVLRHYYRGGLFGKLVRDRYFWQGVNKTRAFAEFQLLKKLSQKGINVPKPLIAHVEKKGWSYRADLICEKIDNAKDLVAILQDQQLSQKTWRQIGQLIRQMHNAQVCHTDLNAHNILLQAQGTKREKAFLIDFDKCSEKRGEQWKADNLSRLKRSFNKEKHRHRILFTEMDWQYLLQGYKDFTA